MCPFLDKANPRCAARQSLQNLDDALGLCADHFEACPVYQEMLPNNALSNELPEPIRTAG